MSRFLFYVNLCLIYFKTEVIFFCTRNVYSACGPRIRLTTYCIGSYQNTGIWTKKKRDVIFKRLDILWWALLQSGTTPKYKKQMPCCRCGVPVNNVMCVAGFGSVRYVIGLLYPHKNKTPFFVSQPLFHRAS